MIICRSCAGIFDGCIAFGWALPIYRAVFLAETKAMGGNRRASSVDLSLIFLRPRWHREAGRMAGRQHGASFVVYLFMAHFRRNTIGGQVRRDRET
jgi:hypothetical protein